VDAIDSSPIAASVANAQITDPVVRQEFGKLMAEFKDLFLEGLPPGLPPHRAVEHHIPTIPGAEPPSQRPYRLPLAAQAEMQRQLTAALENGLIRPSYSPYAAPVLFVRKKDGSMRMCIDYRALNKQTVKDKFPMPLVDDLLDALHGASVFSKIDLKSAYYQVRVAEEDVPKTAFRTSLGHFEWLVMPFGLTGAPSTFQRLMAQLFGEYNGKFVANLLDDLLIYSPSEVDHVAHLRLVLQKLRDAQLYAAASKCDFFRPEMEFLGSIVSADGRNMVAKKVQAIQDWPTPSNVHELKSFLGLAGYYSKHVKSFATLARPLYDLTRKHQHFCWRAEHDVAFYRLKAAVSSAPVLILPDHSKPYFILTDASDYATGAVLCQDHGKGLQPIAFLSQTLQPAHRNYATYDKEMLAIVRACSAWRHLIAGADTKVYSDHQPLSHFLDQRSLSHRQMRWKMQLDELGDNFKIRYMPGRENTVADALSRRPDQLAVPSADLDLNDDLEAPAAAAALDIAPMSELEQQQYTALLSSITFVQDDGFIDQLKSAYAADPLAAAYLCGEQRLAKGFVRDGLLYVRRRGAEPVLYVPANQDIKRLILREQHDIPIAGHLGRDKTYAAIARNFYWPCMQREIFDYVKECPTCQQVKSSNRKPAGLLQPLPIPATKFSQVNMDLIGPLPATERGHTAILTVVDRLSRAALFIPCAYNSSASAIARLFFDNVFRHFGMPTVIVSDRDPRFTSHFWQHLTDLFGIKRSMSTAYHPQTDGLAERANRTIEDMLRCFVDRDQPNDWDLFLTPLEFAYNNSVNPSTGYTPFYLLHGQHPIVPSSLFTPKPTIVPAVDDFVASISRTLTFAKRNLAAAQNRQKQYADQHRRPEVFQPGDKVMLSTSHLTSTHVSGNVPRFWPKYIGPFEVARAVNENAYELVLPETYQIPSVHNVSLLKHYHESSDPERLSRPPPLFATAQGPEYLVEDIVGREVGADGVVRYWVKWVGYPAEDNTREPLENLQRPAVKALVDAYNARHGVASSSKEGRNRRKPPAAAAKKARRS